MSQRQTFTPEFKREAVQWRESGSRPSAQIAGVLGIKRNQLSKWQVKLNTRKEGAFPGSGRKAGRKSEVSRLKKLYSSKVKCMVC